MYNVVSIQTVDIDVNIIYEFSYSEYRRENPEIQLSVYLQLNRENIRVFVELIQNQIKSQINTDKIYQQLIKIC